MVVGFSTASLKLLLVSRLSGRIKVEEKRLRLRNVGEEMIVHPNIPSTLVWWRIHTVRSLRSVIGKLISQQSHRLPTTALGQSISRVKLIIQVIFYVKVDFT